MQAENQKDHIPVLLQEVLGYLDPKPNDNIIDGTVGNAGHAKALLEKTAPHGKLLGIDADSAQVTNARRELAAFSERVILVNDSYANIAEIVDRVRVRPIHGILLDLGYSSWHMEQSGKGFSFMKDEPLDMRYGLPAQAGDGELTAAQIVNRFPQPDLERIFQEYGEEKFSRQIAREIANTRKHQEISTTAQLVTIIGQAIPEKFKHGKIHYATRIFQALRIAVNSELQTVEHGVRESIRVLESGGKLAVISFHSLEDRIVKNLFRDAQKEGTVTILTKKPVVAEPAEIAGNPRSRSAKLRVISKL